MSYSERCINTNENEVIFEKFHKLTSLNYNNYHIFEENIANAFDNTAFMDDIYRNTIFLNSSTGIQLNNEAEVSEDSFYKALLDRHTSREFSDSVISFEKFSNVLCYGYGASTRGVYTVPSAGGTYPISLIIIVNKVEGLKKGIYEYSPIKKSLIPIHLLDNLSPESITLNVQFFDSCAFSIHFVGSPNLICYKYQDRGYRFMNLEAGHIAQNLALVATRNHINSVFSGGFLDGEFIQFLNTITDDRFTNFVSVYEMFFGS